MNKTKLQKKNMRHRRVRAKIQGTASRPRIAVFKSNRFTYAQVIDDTTGKTLLNVSDYAGKPSSRGQAEGKAKASKGNKTAKATAAGQKLAEALKAKGINEAIFDRGGFKYHGRVKALADGLRNAGIKI